MNWKDQLNNIGYTDREDTEEILEIAVHFLVIFFGHTTQYASDLMFQFLQKYSEVYDEDYIHHDLSYRVAAIVHFAIHLNGSMNDVKDWLIETGHIKGNQEATEYFRKHYLS